ncbi:hypothetical protein JTB14_030116 [Gonioctena quinquepunctata]|nr:hypothetical protein JTB14_030116 [Gonioctena quinquepunctata]
MMAQSLIKRSKQQLQEITKIQNNEDYVPMDNRKGSVIEEDDGSDIYCPVDPLPNIEAPITVEDFAYSDLPAKDASQGIKYGYISMRRKSLWVFEGMKRVFATILKGGLLVYWSERDTKPFCSFNLKNFYAKASVGDKNNFELISTASDKKVYQFLALTRKDMKQWVVNINKCNNCTNIMEPENEYGNESATNMDSEDSDREDIYAEPKLNFPGSIKKPTPPSPTEVKPPLPLGRPGRPSNNKQKMPIKVSPPVVKSRTPSNSSDDEVSYEDLSGGGANLNYFPPPPLPPNPAHEVHPKISNNSLSNSTKSFDSSFSNCSEESDYVEFSEIRMDILRRFHGEENNTVDGPSREKVLMPSVPAIPMENSSTESAPGKESSLAELTFGNQNSLSEPAPGKENSMAEPETGKENSLIEPASGKENSLIEPAPGKNKSLTGPARQKEKPSEISRPKPFLKPKLKEKPSGKKIPPPPPKRGVSNK